MWACPVGGHSNTFCPRRAAKNGNGNTFCPRRAAEGRGERQRQHLLSAKGRGERQRQHLLSTKGHEEHLYWSTWGRENTFLVHIGLRRTLFGPSRTPFLIGEGHFLLPFLGRAGSLSMLTGEGTHKGRPYGWITTALTGEGTHKGCPYGWIICAHGGRAPTRGAPTVGLLVRTRGEGAHMGRPYGWIICAHTGCPYPIQAASVGANGVWRRRCALGWPPTC